MVYKYRLSSPWVLPWCGPRSTGLCLRGSLIPPSHFLPGQTSFSPSPHPNSYRIHWFLPKPKSRWGWQRSLPSSTHLPPSSSTVMPYTILCLPILKIYLWFSKGLSYTLNKTWTLTLYSSFYSLHTSPFFSRQCIASDWFGESKFSSHQVKKHKVDCFLILSYCHSFSWGNVPSLGNFEEQNMYPSFETTPYYL